MKYCVKATTQVFAWVHHPYEDADPNPAHTLLTQKQVIYDDADLLNPGPGADPHYFYFRLPPNPTNYRYLAVKKHDVTKMP